MNSIVPHTHPAVLRYSQGAVSASEAADLMGGDATVHDVIQQLREAGLPLPRQPREVELAELVRARKLFGLTS